MHDMKKSIQIKEVISFCKDYWFSVSLFFIVCAIIVKNDISVEFSPNKIESTPVEKNSPDKKVKEHSTVNFEKGQKYTDQRVTKKLPIAKGNMTLVNPFAMFQPSTLLEVVPKPKPVEPKKELLTQDEQAHVQFVNRFSKVAINEMNKFGIPASIVLAQGILASNAGRSKAAQKSNSFFEVPCTKDWKKGRKLYVEKCNRVYDTAWESFRDHSKFITSGPYKYLNRFSTTNYHEWSKGLQLIGYIDNPYYSKKLISIIEKYDLAKYDKPSSNS